MVARAVVRRHVVAVAGCIHIHLLLRLCCCGVVVLL